MNVSKKTKVKCQRNESFDLFPPLGEAGDIIDCCLNELTLDARSASEFIHLNNIPTNCRISPKSFCFYIKKGCLKFQLRNKADVIIAETGDVVVIAANLAYSFTPCSPLPCDFIVTSFYAKVGKIIDLFELLQFYGKCPHIAGVDFRSDFEELARLGTIQPPAWRFALAAQIELFIFKLLFFYSSKISQNFSIKKYQLFCRFIPLLSFLDKNISNPDMSVSDLAEEIEMSEGYLRKLFKETFGISPRAFIVRQRINLACMHLKNNTHIHELLLCCGFREPHYFYRTFKKIMGMTPKEFKNYPNNHI